VIALTIDVKNSSSQSIKIQSNATGQEIKILNTPKQDIQISIDNEPHEVNILKPPQSRTIEIVPPWTTRKELKELKLDIAIKVPMALSILPQAEDEQFATSKMREMSRMFVDVDGSPSFVTLEQVKKLNTKTILAGSLTDNRIKTLSNDDIILLEER
jgi:hypothetical protein